MKKLALSLIAVIIVTISLIVIHVIGQEVIAGRDIKNISIQQFEFKGKTNYVLFIETEQGEKLECSLLPEQKSKLMQVISDEIKELKLIMGKQ